MFCISPLTILNQFSAYSKIDLIQHYKGKDYEKICNEWVFLMNFYCKSNRQWVGSQMGDTHESTEPEKQMYVHFYPNPNIRIIDLKYESWMHNVAKLLVMKI